MPINRCGVIALAGLAAVAASPGAAADTIRVNVDKLTFAPAQVSAKVGDTIEWVSTDFIAHTATARDKQWDVMIPAKGTGRTVLNRVGDIDYFCRFHPTMTGHVTVTGP